MQYPPPRRPGLVCWAVLLLVTCTVPAQAFEIMLDPPGPREFVSDLAGLLHASDRAAVVTTSEALLNEQAVPILTVTIPSMAAHGGEGLRIETFATVLYDQWGIGHESIEGQPWNKGILLLIARDDRKARIELGAGYAHDYDVTCQRIMDGLIIPEFKSGNFSAGIRAGVEGLDRMVRRETLPVPRRAPAQSVSPGVLSGCGSGMGIGKVFMWIAALFGGAAMGRGRSGGGGSFSGGSFGGGFSGGGGASGSW